MSELGRLEPIVARKLLEADALHCAAAALSAQAQALAPARPLSESLRGGAVIAEIKRRSPSGGQLAPDLDPARLAHEYVTGGAAAISVVTDGVDFGGSLDDLQAVRNAVDLPLLRKDFIVDPLQIAEARVAGADWILLIAAVLDDDALAVCLSAAQRAHADAIVEVHSADEVRRAVAAGASCIGINNRDLTTLTTDIATFERLREHVPDGIVCVAESGIETPEDVARLVDAGADAVLIGEILLRATSPGDLCRAMVTAGQRALR